MATFPRLKTNAVAQYPAERIRETKTRILHFLDGSEQRYPVRIEKRRWRLRLEQLSEGELHEVESFFREVSGSASPFAFTDPWSGVQYPSCRLAGEALPMRYEEGDRGETVVEIVEN